MSAYGTAAVKDPKTSAINAAQQFLNKQRPVYILDGNTAYKVATGKSDTGLSMAARIETATTEPRFVYLKLLESRYCHLLWT